MIDQNSVGLGRLPSLDPRDASYPLRRLLELPTPPPEGLVSPFPGDYYYSFIPPVLDQGSTSQCVGYSMRAWLTQYPVNRLGGPSAAAIYQEAQRLDEWPGEAYDGTSVRAGFKHLQSLGLVQSYWWASSIEEIIEGLKTKGPVVLGTNWYSGMFRPLPNNVLEVKGSLVGGHAYLCYGLSTAYQVFACLNSWGSDFAQGGTFWLTFDSLRRLLREEGEAAIAVESPLAVSKINVVLDPIQL